MKKLLSKDENQVRYLLENGLTEVTYFKTKNDKPFTHTYASYWHPYELRQCAGIASRTERPLSRDFSQSSTAFASPSAKKASVIIIMGSLKEVTLVVLR